jgi:peptidoglycan hydrolase-like protein with peptidoglycan-binding domain
MATTPFYKTFELRLVSPHFRDGVGSLKGQTLVRDLQYLLNNHSKNALNSNRPFGDFYNGKPDGDYGPYTASAVRQAKWFLGYPKAQCNSVAGPILQDYLRGNEKASASLSSSSQRKAKPESGSHQGVGQGAIAAWDEGKTCGF